MGTLARPSQFAVCWELVFRCLLVGLLGFRIRASGCLLELGVLQVPVKELKDAVERNTQMTERNTQMTQKYTQVTNQVGNMVLQISAVRPIRADAERTRKRSRWGSDVRRHFQLPDGELVCSVLSQVYADTMKQADKWCRSKGWGSPSPVIPHSHTSLLLFCALISSLCASLYSLNLASSRSLFCWW